MTEPAQNAPFRRKHPRTGPNLVDVQMNLVLASDPVVGRVFTNEQCTARTSAAAFTRHVVIDVSGTPLAGVCTAGQSFGVVPPGTDERGRPHSMRLYSLASPTAGENANPNLIATTVKRLIDEHHDTGKLFLGVCSNFLCDTQPGDEVLVCGPSGKRFVLPANPGAHDYVFFATGTGIAPFRAMLHDLLAQSTGSRIVLVAGVPYATDLMYHDTFVSLDKQHSNFMYLPTVSRHAQFDGSPSCYVQDRLVTHKDLLIPMLESSRTLMYVCGILGMELGLCRTMHQVLAPEVLAPWMTIDGSISHEPASWNQKMMYRQIKPSGRVFIETY
ncbi:MAG: hypothetical protein H6815_07740 [Phycisphaeraceae bacterium]|nr:hypothetical protein [Phycisphaerales bacterium]MCB9860333.1 hypothetical protein [Phycisphaeraceae bacterium]